MPTPVGPVPRDPEDPDLWDWGEGADPPARRLSRILIVGLVVVALVLLVVISVL
jgi:hypothetical protein